MDSIELIGNPKRRFNQLKLKQYDWCSFYNGWLEGRMNMAFGYPDEPKNKEAKIEKIDIGERWDMKVTVERINELIDLVNKQQKEIKELQNVIKK
jgi:beta-lactamase superfamily II metal-dependent hydrolase